MPLQEFFGTLGSVDQDLMIRVLTDMVEASSERSARPVQHVVHQLRREVDREKRKCDVLRGQLHEVERLLVKLRGAQNGDATAEAAFLLATMRDRAEELQQRISSSTVEEKIGRLSRLKQTLLSAKNKAEAAKLLLELVAPERTKDSLDARSRIS